MRSKLVLAALITLLTLPACAQVAPAVKIGGLPLGIGGGFSDYSVDFGPGRRMTGASVWADYNLFHGLGVEGEATWIFASKPSVFTRMEQDSYKGGLIYKTRPFFGIRPFAKGLVGLGHIDFPSRKPCYTHDSRTIYTAGGGAEYKVWKTLYARGEYEYQFWPELFGPHTLNPNGFSIGATYYLRGIHRHY
jgi:opacity protein-like surface antigen